MTANQPYLPQDDLLWRQLKTIPAFRALLRAVESRFYRQVALPGPILDVGCGDGHFAQMTFDHPLDVGIDPWWGPLHKAQHSGQYKQVLQGMGDRLPFPDNSFGSAISNSVLEHIPDVQPVLSEIGRVLQPGGRLVITMPSHNFTQNLGGAAFLQALGLPGLADRYRQFFNFISRHAHTDAAEVWAERLAQAGFVVERWQYYFSTGALRALEWGHVQGLPSAVLHALTGHWIVAPWQSSLGRTERWLRPFYTEEAPGDGAYVLFIARKAAEGRPVKGVLPAARPFTITELAQEREGELAPEQEEEWAERPDQGTRRTEEAQPVREMVEGRVLPTGGPKLITGGLTLLALLFTALAQANLRSGGSAGTQLGLSGLMLLLLWAYRQPRDGPRELHWPKLASMHRKRLLIAPAFILSLLAFSSSNGQRPLLALLLWGTAVGLALYALWPTAGAIPKQPAETPYGRWVILGLFVAALLLRTINLAGLPFILNGTEAIQGLEALRITRGEWLTPFSTSTQGFPGLPFFLMAGPLQVFGPSAVSLRFIAPLVGAMTVVATYWLGQQLWDRTVGLTAAILLSGSYWHLHYSRLGLTIIWDPLWMLLALGLVGVAWQKQRDSKAWLAAGTAVGLGVYFISDPRLLPGVLLALALLGLLGNRAGMWAQKRALLAATLVALVAALPQLLYDQSQPVSAWTQANQTSILNPQNNWLAGQAASNAQSPGAVLRQQIERGLLVFNGPADNSPSFRTQNGLLGFGAGLLLLVGVVTAVFHLQDGRTGLLLAWLGGAMLLGAVLLPNPPQSDRLLVATPAVALLSGWGLITVARWQGQSRATLVLGVTALVAMSEGGYYYGRYPAENSFADRNTEIAHRVADYLNTFDETWAVYFYGPPAMYVDFPTISFLAPQFQKNVNLFDVDPLPNSQTPSTSSSKNLYIFLPERRGEIAVVKNSYPGSQEQTFAGVFGNPLFYSVEVSLPANSP